MAWGPGIAPPDLLAPHSDFDSSLTTSCQFRKRKCQYNLVPWPMAVEKSRFGIFPDASASYAPSDSPRTQDKVPGLAPFPGLRPITSLRGSGYERIGEGKDWAPGA